MERLCGIDSDGPPLCIEAGVIRSCRLRLQRSAACWRQVWIVGWPLDPDGHRSAMEAGVIRSCRLRLQRSAALWIVGGYGLALPTSEFLCMGGSRYRVEV